MDKALARIVKRGSQWCVVSEDGSKNLGCSPTREGAVQRLRQVEHFKNTKGSHMDYNQAFNNMGKALSSEIDPSKICATPDSQPRLVNHVSQSLSIGTIAGKPSDKLLDKKEHFPVTTETQARSSLTRVMQLKTAPVWYRGSLEELQNDVYQGAIAAHPACVNTNVQISIDKVIALSDGQTPAETSEKDIKNPADIQKTLVPEVDRPTITTAELQAIYENDDQRTALAGQIMDCIEQQEETLMAAKKLATRLMKKGLSGEDFNALTTYMQENILREMLVSEQDSADAQLESRRQELLERLKGE
jgi:hypothetical protein